MKLSKKKVHELKNERKVIDIKKEKTAAEAVVGRDTSTRRAENRVDLQEDHSEPAGIMHVRESWLSKSF